MGAEASRQQAIYSSGNVKVAYQLDWSLTLFWRTPVWTDDWVPALQKSLEPDRIRVLKHRFPEPGISLFLISTQVDVMPISIPHRVKGRLYHILRDQFPQPFQRNYDLQSIGSTTRAKLEDYLTGQLEHHPESDRKFHWVLSDMQVIHPEMDLSEPRFTSHGRFSSNLHLVLVRDWRKRETDHAMLAKVRRMVIRAAETKQHRLSHLAILPDHFHLLLGIRLEESPLSVGLSYLNNIAYVYGMQPVLKHSFFVGTFGEYDLGAIQ